MRDRTRLCLLERGCDVESGSGWRYKADSSGQGSDQAHVNLGRKVDRGPVHGRIDDNSCNNKKTNILKGLTIGTVPFLDLKDVPVQ